MYKFFTKYISRFVELYSILPLLSAFGLNMLIYSGAQILCADWTHYDFTLAFDRSVPVIPWFMYIYFGCYLFWIANYILIGRLGKEHFYKYISADMISRLICGLFFVLLPTTNIRPEIVGTSLSENLLRFLYQVDQPANLFPSIHCLVSWFCYIGIRGKKEIPVWYRAFSCVFAIAVMVSTQVTKQHYIVDVISAVILAETLYFITNHSSIYKYVMSFFTKVNQKVANYFMKEKSFGKQKENGI